MELKAVHSVNLTALNKHQGGRHQRLDTREAEGVKNIRMAYFSLGNFE